MNLDQFVRRKTMLKLYYANSLTPTTMRALAEQSHISEYAIRKDWNRKSIWEPVIWAMSDCKNDPEVILRGLLFAKEQALKLMGSADQDSVKVAAIGRYSDIIRLEVELRQSLGTLPKVAEKVEQKIEGKIESNVNVTDNLAEYEHLIKAFRIEKSDIPKNHSDEQVHQAQTPNPP